MAALKFVVFAALVACTFAAEEEERVKKDVLLGTLPVAHTSLPLAYTYGYDDGKYYPGKYEKPALVAPAAYHVPAVSSYSSLPAVSSYSSLPAVGGYSHYGYHYGAYPYNYGAYPYYKSYVY